MEFRMNQKVRVVRHIKDDGTCCGSCRGETVAELGSEGYVCDVTEFLFEPVVVVHFLETNKKIGFREKELEVIEDFDPDTMEWFAPKETCVQPDADAGHTCSGSCGGCGS